MQAIGIVCEYNPFHSGHLWQLETCRARLGPGTPVLCVMSGDFVQRGEAALFDKFARAEAACRCGADLVVELPLPWCLRSAEGFARGAVSLLAALGVSHLGFGSECGDVDALSRLAEFLSEEPAQARIRGLLAADASLSYARARQHAAAEELGETAALLENPNDILAVEYLKAIRRLHAPMAPLAVKRAGAGHDGEGEGSFRSAMQLRAMLARGESAEGFIPPAALEVFRREAAAGKTADGGRLDAALLSRLCLLRPEDFDGLSDAAGGAGRRLYRALQKASSPAQAAALAAGKRHTSARMRRMLLCAALGVGEAAAEGAPPCARVLACGERGREWLRAERERFAVPVLTKPAAVRSLPAPAEELFALGARAHDLYCLGFSGRDCFKAGEDWRKSPAIV